MKEFCGTGRCVVGQKIPLIFLAPFCNIFSRESSSMAPFWHHLHKIRDFVDRKVFSQKEAVYRGEYRSAEGGTRTHTEFPPHAPQACVSTSSTTSATIVLYLSSFVSVFDGAAISGND